MNYVRRRSGSIRIVYWAGLVSLVAVLSWFCLAYIVTHAKGSLPERVAADVIVPLAGSPDRSAYAKTLRRRQAAPNIVSTLVDPRCLRTRGPDPACATRVRNTIDEAIVLRRIFEEERFTRVIVVTSRYHLARAAAVFAIIFAGSGTDVHFIASPEAHLTREQVTREVMKYLPSLAAAVLVRFVPALYEWSVRNRPVCHNSVTLSSE
jgi:DUF218 domain-containing protein